MAAPSPVSILAEKILSIISTNGTADTLDDLSKVLHEDHQKVIGALKSIQALDADLLVAEPRSKTELELTKEGKLIAENGSHEAAVWHAIPTEGISQAELMKKVPNSFGFSKAMSNRWITIQKINGASIVSRQKDSIDDTVHTHLLNIHSGMDNFHLDEDVKKDYKKRKLVQEVIVKTFLLSKGKNFTLNPQKLETDLSSDMMATGAWKTQNFKPYNFAALGVQPDIGHLHPLLKVRTEFRQIFLEMGFTEMATNNYVESSFWNFDALFQPQQHPARDAHDTFFISDPKSSTKFPQDYLKRVKEVHSHGGYGSQGYGYDWKVEEAQKNLLRTHTTAVSARMLYKLAQSPQGFHPVKYFSIDRVFRNETLDATHLAEFHQVEGVVADYNLTLGDLIGVLHEFFKKLGLEKLQFKPAYNPYTEPSMEIFCFHPGLDKWVEIGNSGIFRPEMVLPMGLPKDVNIIAWGLSLERPTMIKYGLNNIRDLVGPKVDLQMVFDNPICRLEEKACCQPRATGDVSSNGESRLAGSGKRYCDVATKGSPQQWSSQSTAKDSHDIKVLMIKVDPKYWPFSLIQLAQLLGVDSISHTLPPGKKSFCNTSLDAQRLFKSGVKSANVNNQYKIDVTWDELGKDPIFIHPVTRVMIIGEVNIARLISRLLVQPSSQLLIPEFDSGLDQWLDLIHGSLIHGSAQKRAATLSQINETLADNKWLMGKQATIADICLWSVLYRITNSVEDTHVVFPTKCPNVARFYKYCNQNVESILESIKNHHVTPF